MSLKKYNVKENYNHAGTRKIPFYKMDEAELVEALTPEESGKLERVTFWEFNDIRKHPGVKETVCIDIVLSSNVAERKALKSAL